MNKEKADVVNKDGSLYYNPQDPESINAALKEAMTLTQVAAFKAGQDQVNYRRGYSEGVRRGWTYGSIVTSAIFLASFVISSIVFKKRGNK